MAKARGTVSPFADALREAFRGVTSSLDSAIKKGEQFNSLWDSSKLRSYAGALQNITSNIPVAGRLTGFLGEIINTAQAIGTLTEGFGKLASGKLQAELTGGTSKTNATQSTPTPLLPRLPQFDLPSFSKPASETPTLPGQLTPAIAAPTLSGQATGTQSVEIVHPLPLPVEVTNWQTTGGTSQTPFATSAPSSANSAGDKLGEDFAKAWKNNEPGATQSGVTATNPFANVAVPEIGGIGAEGGAEAVGGVEAAGGLGAAAGPVGMVAAAALVAGKAIFDLGEKAIQTGFQFAQIASPATMDLYNRAVLDSEAVLGQRFVPVVELATVAVRDVGDFFAEILPSTGEFRASLAEFKPALDDIRDAARDVAPIIKDVFGASLQLVAAGAKDVSSAVKFATIGFRALANNLGIPLGGPAVSSVGAAAGSVSIGSIEDVSRKMFEAAVGQGRQIDSPTRSANSLERIEALASGLKAELMTRLDFMQRLLNPVEAGRMAGEAIAAKLGFAPGWGR